jgi:diguanylate cyclase (GGDEF)-like protein
MDDNNSQTADRDSVVDRLVEERWESRDRRGSRRELTVVSAAAVLFGIAAVGLLVVSHAVAAVPLGTACALIAAYAVVSRIEFPVGTGDVVPTQLLLVPMLVLLPPGAVPLAVAAGLVLSVLLGFALGRVPARRVLSAVPDAWHAVGPAAVLVAAGSPHVTAAQLPLMGLAFAACCLVDLVSSIARVRLSGIIVDWTIQCRVILSVWAVDACLAPIGFFAAIAARRVQSATLLVLPLALLLWVLARDRKKRIDHAYGRLKLLEHERSRLRAAVGRLGDAFAAKLQLEALLQTLLHGSVEALSAVSGRLSLTGLPGWSDLQIGDLDGLRLLEATGAVTGSPIEPVEPVILDGEECWTIVIPIRIQEPSPVTGTIGFVRRGRAFEPDELTMMSELVAKAELAAREILIHNELREQVLTDPLTGLGNRRKLMADLTHTFVRAAQGFPSMLLLFDLDGFKNYNDTFGHLAGDALLARMGAKLQQAVAPSGAAYRLGGDEFCAWIDLQDVVPDELILRASEALIEKGPQFCVRGSLGVVLLPNEADTPERAIQLADERMYANKRNRGTGTRTRAKDVLLRTMQAMQPELDAHAGQVAGLAIRVARRFGLAGEQLEEIGRAAELHCVGKVGIPDTILEKPGPLSRDEWEFMRRHTIVGERLLRTSPSLRPVAVLVRASHERWDGRGYPDGLAGESIPLGSRIVAVCDAYDAMTSDRPYRPAFTHEVACRELRAGAGTQFDQAVVDIFLAEVERAAEEQLSDPAQAAAEHVRALLAARD